MNTTLDTLKDSRITYTTSAVRNGVLCLLAVQKPRHPLNGTELTIQFEDYANMGRTTVHRVFPNSVIHDRSACHRVANFVYFPEEVTDKLDINNSKPSEYMSELKYKLGSDFDRIMMSHLIPVDDSSGIWSDDFDLFVEQRARLMLARLFQRAGVLGDSVRGDDAVPAAIEIEKALRTTIHKALANYHGSSYWQIAVSTQMDKNIQKEYERAHSALNKLLSASLIWAVTGQIRQSN